MMNNLSTEQIDLFQEVADWRINNIALKESVTVIANYIDTHLAEETKVYEFGHERYMNVEQRRALEAERKLRDKPGHMKLRKYLTGHISCLDSLKPTQLRKTTLVALE